jgi:hypothetical protein
VRRVASVLGAVPAPPLPDPVLGDAVALRHHPCRLVAFLDRRPHLRSPLCLNPWRINGSPSSPACKERSACSPPVPKLAHDRSCIEERRPTRVYVVIRDGTATRPSVWEAILGRRSAQRRAGLPNRKTRLVRVVIVVYAYRTKATCSFA